MERNKGSYKRMRELVLEQNLYLIEDLINEPIQWICPKHENGRELQLNGKDTLTFLGLPKDFFFRFLAPKITSMGWNVYSQTEQDFVFD